MHWLDERYVLELSSSLEKFKKKGNLYNFRCPICLDSQKSKKKTRAYILANDKGTFFYCHNCGVNMRFSKFLEQQRPDIYRNYIVDKLVDERTFQAVEVKETKTEIDGNSAFAGLKKVSQLPITHPVRKYIGQRQIPPNFHYKIYYCPKFKQWVNSVIPNKFEEPITQDEPRLLFVLLNKDKKPFGVNARSLIKGTTSPKYITIKFDESMPKVFGLESIDAAKDIFVFEGPVDSMMVTNGIATCGGVLTSEVSKLTNIDKERFVLVFDNEPRKKETVAHIDKAIKEGYRVALIPPEYVKDANAIITNNIMTHTEYKKMLRDNTVQGLEAQLKFAFWRKID